MDLQAEKLGIIHRIAELNDESLIAKIKAILFDRTQQASKISQEERKEIKQGLKDIEEGNTFTHEQVMENVESRFANLLK